MAKRRRKKRAPRCEHHSSKRPHEVVHCTGGIGNRLRAIASRVLVHGQRQECARSKVVVLWQPSEFSPGAFDSTFLPTPPGSGVTVMPVADASQAASLRSKWHPDGVRVFGCNGLRLEGEENEAGRMGPAPVVRLYQYLFRPTAALQQRMDTYLAQFPLRDCVGVHLRTTDHAVMFDTYARRALAAGSITGSTRNFTAGLFTAAWRRVAALRAESHPPRCLFVAADSVPAAREWAAGDAVRGLRLAPSPHAAGEWLSTRPQQHAAAAAAAAATTTAEGRSTTFGVGAPRTTELVGGALDLLLLSNCGWFLGTMASSFSATVPRLRFFPSGRASVLVPEPEQYWTAAFKFRRSQLSHE